ncbi:hypothetical protein AAFC00_000179 [Neodothiora populina]|uniref:Protein kinase domain-containing protein n=1 Tax=Neodothiora populina TaxID=2781224 RepID=A0ABR3P206_9PEZI
MQSISHFAGDLTLLYTETKKKALNSTGKHETIPALSHLDRRLRIQKDRLVTWGLEWTDQEKGSGGDIDASVAEAGMTETVTSVLGNIQEVLEQAENIKSSVSAWSTPEKSTLSASDETKYGELLKDLSSSIDILYEISTTRRAIAAGSHPTFSSDRYEDEYAPGTIVSGTTHRKQPLRSPSFAASELTLVNPAFARPNLSPYAGLPASLNPQALELPAEAPPPYDTFGVPSATRMIGRLIKPLAPESVQAALPSSSHEAYVLVEYANYDSLYHATGVPPPLQRLEGLAAALAAIQAKQQQSLILLGYFEDPSQPRIGLVYDFLGAIHDRSRVDQLVPVSLLNLVQTANKGGKPADVANATPFLEDRFKVALRVAENLRDLHVEGYSHGNLNSGSVVFFRQGQSSQLRRGELHRPTLSAFDMFSRTRVERTNDAPTMNITRHPLDHNGDQSYIKAVQFDLYGLALLLLEIGLWVPLHDLYKAKYTLKDFKLRIEKIWVPRLAAKCGSLYMRAVQTCLRLSDDPEIDKINPDVIYENIIRRLKRCCYLDEDEMIMPETDMVTPQDQVALWHNLTSNRPLQGQMQKHVPKTSNTLSTPAMSSAFSTRSTSTIRDEPDVADRTASATRGITSRGSTVEKPPVPFREYRQKVVFVQRRWRECCRHIRERRNRPAASDRSTDILHGGPHLERRFSATEARRSSESLRRCQVFPIKLPQPALDDWHTNLGMRLSRIVERALKDSSESSSIDLVGLGHDLCSAKPTILVTCASTARVKAALKRKFDYDRSMFDLKVRKGRIALARGSRARDKLASRTNSIGGDNDDGESDDAAPLNPYFQQRPLCGASIGAYLPSYGHLDPVSYGGVVMVERGGQVKPYGMSVHHMLDPPEGDDGDNSAMSSSTNTNTDLDESSSISSTLESSEEDSDEDGGYVSSDFESDISDDETGVAAGHGRASHRAEAGDKAGVTIDMSPAIQVTQPAFRDAWDMQLHADDAPLEELDEDHLASYRLGSVFASSGLRRVTRGGMRHEIDWALIELDPPRLQNYNLVQGGRRYYSDASSGTDACNKVTVQPDLKTPVCRQEGVYGPKDDLYPMNIVASQELAGLDVQCFGRTSGLARGTINAYMSFVKIRGRRTFSACWSVMGGFGVGGDSGAWVLDNRTAGLCGHVLAESNGMAYLCSMQVLFEDMKATLGASAIYLPGGESNAVVTKGAVIVHGDTRSTATQSGPTTALEADIAGSIAGLEITRDGAGAKSQSLSARRSRYTGVNGKAIKGKSSHCVRLGQGRQETAVRT